MPTVGDPKLTVSLTQKEQVEKIEAAVDVDITSAVGRLDNNRTRFWRNEPVTVNFLLKNTTSGSSTESVTSAFNGSQVYSSNFLFSPGQEIEDSFELDLLNEGITSEGDKTILLQSPDDSDSRVIYVEVTDLIDDLGWLSSGEEPTNLWRVYGGFATGITAETQTTPVIGSLHYRNYTGNTSGNGTATSEPDRERLPSYPQRGRSFWGFVKPERNYDLIDGGFTSSPGAFYTGFKLKTVSGAGSPDQAVKNDPEKLNVLYYHTGDEGTDDEIHVEGWGASSVFSIPSRLSEYHAFCIAPDFNGNGNLELRVYDESLSTTFVNQTISLGAGYLGDTYSYQQYGLTMIKEDAGGDVIQGNSFWDYFHVNDSLTDITARVDIQFDFADYPY